MIVCCHRNCDNLKGEHGLLLLFLHYSSRQVTGPVDSDPFTNSPAAFLANTQEFVSVSFTESSNGEEVVRYNGVVALEPASQLH